MMQPFAMQHILMGRWDISPRRWLKLSSRTWSQLQSKPPPCLSYWLLFRLSIKEGAKPTMFLQSMVQSAFPNWVHRNVELFVAQKKRKKKENNNKIFSAPLQILQRSWLALCSLHCSPHLHALGKQILLLFEEELFWLVFLLCLLSSEVLIGSCFPFFWTIKEHKGMCFKLTVHMNVTVRPFLLSNRYNYRALAGSKYPEHHGNKMHVLLPHPIVDCEMNDLLLHSCS